MQYFQILACNDTLGTCCNDYGIVRIIDTIRSAFGLIQIFVPIILLVMATIQLTALIANPDAKGGMKKLTNKFVAAVIVFFLPMMVDIFMGWMPADDTFQMTACWQAAQQSNEVLNLQKTVYIDKYSNKKRSSILINPGEYEKGDEKHESSSGGSGSGSAK